MVESRIRGAAHGGQLAAVEAHLVKTQEKAGWSCAINVELEIKTLSCWCCKIVYDFGSLI